MVFRALLPLAETSTIIVERRVETINDDGMVTYGSELFYDITAIVVGSFDTLDRQPEYQTTQGDTIEVTTNFALQGPSEVELRSNNKIRYQPDLVTWHGGVYVVTGLVDMSKWSSGFVKAMCSSIRHIESTPMGP